MLKNIVACLHSVENAKSLAGARLFEGRGKKEEFGY
jgi:hypothetical protein